MTLAGAARADIARAKVLYGDGEVAFAGGRYAEAARAFEAAFAESRSPSLLFNVAQAFRRQYEVDHDITNLRRAATVYRNYLDLVSAGSDRDDANAALAEVTKQLEVLERQARTPEQPVIDKAPPVPPSAPVIAEKAQSPSAPPRAVVAATPIGVESDPRRTPAYRRWWLWAAVGGAVVVIAGVGLAVGLTPNDAGTPPTTLGALRF